MWQGEALCPSPTGRTWRSESPDLGSLPGGGDGICKVTDTVRAPAPPRGAGTLTSHPLRSAMAKPEGAGFRSLRTRGCTGIWGGRSGKCHAETRGEGVKRMDSKHRGLHSDEARVESVACCVVRLTTPICS